MILSVVHCPRGQGTDIVRHGQTRQGKQRYRCREQRSAGRTFLVVYASARQSPEVKRQSVDRAMNASGMRAVDASGHGDNRGEASDPSYRQ